MNFNRKEFNRKQIDQLLDWKNDLISKGWAILPADEPDKLKYGYIAFQYDDDPEEKMLQGHVELFPGAKIQPTELIENPNTFDLYFRQFYARGIFACHNPKLLRFGFVTYDPYSNTISSYQLKSGSLSKLSKKVRNQIMDLKSFEIEKDV